MYSLHLNNKNKNQFTLCEDSLTSSVFDLLKYLPDKILFEILGRSLFHNKFQEVPDSLLSISFWDKWNAENTSNINYVEPDVFLRFDKFDVIVEAKRNDFHQQLNGQIDNEIYSYINEYGTEGKQLYFVQVGGIHGTENEKNIDTSYKGEREVIMCKTHWSRILDAVIHTKNLTIETTGNEIGNLKRIFDDLINVFAYHQFFSLEWLCNLKNEIIDERTLKLNYTIKPNVNWLYKMKFHQIKNQETYKLFDYAGYK